MLTMQDHWFSGVNDLGGHMPHRSNLSWLAQHAFQRCETDNASCGCPVSVQPIPNIVNGTVVVSQHSAFILHEDGGEDGHRTRDHRGD